MTMSFSTTIHWCKFSEEKPPVDKKEYLVLDQYPSGTIYINRLEYCAKHEMFNCNCDHTSDGSSGTGFSCAYWAEADDITRELPPVEDSNEYR